MIFEKYKKKVTDENIIDILYSGKRITGEKLDFSQVLQLPLARKECEQLAKKKQKFTENANSLKSTLKEKEAKVSKLRESMEDAKKKYDLAQQNAKLEVIENTDKSDEIKKRIEEHKVVTEKLKPLVKEVTQLKEKFTKAVHPVFFKVLKTGMFIVVSSNGGIWVIPDFEKPGLYFRGYDFSKLTLNKFIKELSNKSLKEAKETGDSAIDLNDLNKYLPQEIAEDLINSLNEIVPLYIALSDANAKAWEMLKSSPGSTDNNGEPVFNRDNNIIGAQAAIETFLLDSQKKAFATEEKLVKEKNEKKNKALKDAQKKYEEALASYEAGVNELESLKKELDSSAEHYESARKCHETIEKRINEDITAAEEIRNKAVNSDPILFSFAKINEFKNDDNDSYDSKWIYDEVLPASEARESMPYLPLELSAGQAREWESVFGYVFDWGKAIEEGKPNFFIDSPADEGREGRMEMLDNFISTMLLAFPPKSLHFTVIEGRYQVMPFAKDLPDKLCNVINVSNNEEVRSLCAHLKEMLNDSRRRGNQVKDCCPREIVVIAGYERNDRRFSGMMEDLFEVIENGRKAGIYFAIVLDEDITEYDWEDKDATEFEKFFTPYSTILQKSTGKKEDIPEYKLLTRKALVTTEGGEINGTLGDLICTYLKNETESVPNKVYELIQNGTLYKQKPIANLFEQSKADAGSLTVPIAETETGETINLRFDDGDYRSCFIFGRSGSGKSYTLHTILTNMMLKYDPSAVELVLIDFKGVELNYYKDVPHVSALMVNGADKQMVGEILSSIIKEMDKRQELFQDLRVQNISDYNKKIAQTGGQPMKQFVMLVDECQDLFNAEIPGGADNVIKDIARKGRSFGIHMVLATQTLQGTDIPGDALKQFSDFIFMNCAEDDVIKCDINDRNVQKSVSTLVRGEIIYCHMGGRDLPMHGYVYNYAGPDKIFQEETHKNLLSSRFTKPDKKQFYSDASQVFKLDDAEMKALINVSKNGNLFNSEPVAVAALGKNLSIKGDTLYSRFGKREDANLLVLGANDLLQSERVFWGAVKSLYECNLAISNPSRYFMLLNIPEDPDYDALEYHKKRIELIKSLACRPDIELADDRERGDIIERVAATVRSRHLLVEEDPKALKNMDNIYIVIPNQQLFYMRMDSKPKGLDSLDAKAANVSEPITPSKSEPESLTGDLGFGLEMPDMSAFDLGGEFGSSKSIPVGKCGRDLNEELRYIIQQGGTVKVHVLLHSTDPKKIYSGDQMRSDEMSRYFHDIVFLQMLQASSMSIPADSRKIETLSAKHKDLRAIVYSGEKGERTVVPFEFPTILK